MGIYYNKKVKYLRGAQFLGQRILSPVEEKNQGDRNDDESTGEVCIKVSWPTHMRMRMWNADIEFKQS